MLPPLISGLLKPGAYTHPTTALRLIETHISWVILTGDFAYKIKKPLELGFLDFSSLDLRHHFCEEEIRLNRRLAPDIYLAVVAIGGSEDEPIMAAEHGPVLEWAVKMRAFPADATLDRETEIDHRQIDTIARAIAAFHARIARAPAKSAYGEPAAVIAPVAINFTQLDALLRPAKSAPLGQQLARLQAWSQTEGERLTPHFAARKAGGFIRECHGDLHLGNIAWVDQAPLIFDALEFNPALRHIDVANEVAFLVMDLRHRHRDDLAWRLLNAYLDLTGDMAGLAALPFYQVYRAMVRAKVAAILATANDSSSTQSNIQASTQSTPPSTPASSLSSAMLPLSETQAYLQLADRLAHDRRPALLLMHGVSGSGKTWLSQHFLEQLGGIRLRSDVVRKRLFGLQPLEDSSRIPGGIYTQDASARTLASLLDDARCVLDAGLLCIVDATFIHRSWRAPFQALAESMNVPWTIVSVEASIPHLQERISRRQLLGTDASEANHAVLTSQLANLEPFNPVEAAHAIRFAEGWTASEAVDRLRSVLASETS